MNPSWFVIGHRNPDADAICAAIGHAAFLSETGEEGVAAARCGEVPPRVKIVLEKAGLDAPLLLDDVRPTAGSICRKSVVAVRQDDTFLMAYRLMVDHGVRAVPVLNNGGEVRGLLHFLDLLQLLLPPATDGRNVKLLHASLENIASTLGATHEYGALPPTDEEDLIMMVGASSQNTVRERLEAAKQDGTAEHYLVICGDRPFVHELAIQYGVRALIVTGGNQPDPALLEKAKETGIVIICAPHDTATTVKLALCARKVRNIISDDFISLASNQVVSRFAKKIAASSQDLFPVVEAGTRRLKGVFSKSDLVDPPRTKLSLVDHNEFSQAVKGVEESQVIEILDHHRLSGDLITRDPVRFLNEPVGSSSTIVARRFKERGLEPSRSVALCLCAGLVSDTLNLTSPTTTSVDQEMLQWLSGLAQVDPDQFSEEFFASGSLLLHGAIEDIIGTDRKEFHEEGFSLSLSQVEETSLKGLASRKEELIEGLQSLRHQNSYDLCALLVTDIRRHDSILLVDGLKSIVGKIPFEQVGKHEFNACGIVSRKKQLFPAICEAIRLQSE